MKIKLVVPTIHLNGSSRERLTGALEKAAEAVRLAQEALTETSPHGRDYYVQADPTVFINACLQYTNQVMALEDIGAQLYAVWEAINAGKTEADVEICPRLEVAP